MPDLEKVIRGLECCILRDPDDKCRCADCPYNQHEISNAPCANGLKFDALSLLKSQQARIAELEAAQTARVMTPEEVEKVGQGDIIWEELRCNNECIPLMRERNDFYFPHKAYLYLGEIIDCDDYGRNYRCWTKRPTDEQREAVKWDD